MNCHGNRQEGRGFTLVELLVVIAILAIVSAISIPALSAILSSGNVNQNVAQLSDVLEVAREYATANNTYVWVAFYPATSATGINSLSVIVLASNDGTDPASSTSAPWGNTACNYGTVPSSQISLVRKVLTLQQISIAATAGTPPVPSAPSSTWVSTLPSTTSPVAIASSTTGGFFTMTLPATSAAVTFPWAIEFLPSGQARNGASPVAAIDIDLQPQKGSAADTHNLAALRINGLTGQTSVYRQ